MTTDITLAGVTLAGAVPEAKVLNVRRQLLGGRRDSYREVPGRPGAWVFPEEPGDRSLRISVDILATTTALRRAAVRNLAAWADTANGPTPMILDDEPDRYYEVTLAQTPDVDEWLMSGAAELEYRTGPFAFAASTSSQSITATGGVASGSFSASDEVYAFPVLEVTPLDGTITGLNMTLNGDALTWSGTLASGSTLTFSSISYTVTTGPNTDVDLTGAYSLGAVSMANVDGAFGLIVPGSNLYSLAYSGGTATAVRYRLTWRRRYR